MYQLMKILLKMDFTVKLSPWNTKELKRVEPSSFYETSGDCFEIEHLLQHVQLNKTRSTLQHRILMTFHIGLWFLHHVDDSSVELVQMHILYLYIYICVCVYIHTYIHIYIYIYVCVYIRRSFSVAWWARPTEGVGSTLCAYWLTSFNRGTPVTIATLWLANDPTWPIQRCLWHHGQAARW